MANSAGMLKESIWRDKEFRALPRTAQATYAQLLSQKELDRAGIEPLQVSKWVKGCDELTEADLWVDLKLLVERRFIVIDEETDELFVRSYMRHSELTKYPQYVKNALRCAGLVGSELIRHELAIELRRLRNKDATAKAAEIDPGLTVPEPFSNPSGTVPEPFENSASTVNPSGTLPERCGVGEGVGELESVRGSVGGVGQKIHSGETRPSGTRNEPPRFCPKHMPDGTTADCGACGGLSQEPRTLGRAARRRGPGRRGCPAQVRGTASARLPRLRRSRVGSRR
jgi:hypothetical protein